MPKKGPPVFLDYDQAALDAAYDQAAYAPNREQLIKRRISDSELARLCVGEPERLAYGPAEIERLDIYRTERDAAPVFVFIHGGTWRSGRSKDFTAPAEMFLAAGAHYVVPDFSPGAGCPWQPGGARRSGPPRDRLDIRQWRASRQRPEPALCRLGNPREGTSPRSR
jgi:acetyl esterase/lipase